MNPNRQRKQLYGLLGDLPDRSRPISATKISETRTDSYILEKLTLDLNGLESVPAYLVRPSQQQRPGPAILYNHAHGGDYSLGKEELLRGREILQKPPYSQVLTQMGYSVLCIDAWVFGERSGRSESEVFKQMLWSGQVMWGMMVYDSLRAIDYLLTRPEVDPNRVATMGMSMGSTMAWWLAALDTRIRVCVDICCLTDFQELINSRGLDGHGVYYYVPSLLEYFTTSQINALIAPRAHLSLAGNLDELTPPAGLDHIDAQMKKVYAAAKAPHAWRLLRYDVGHMETPDMRQEVVSFLKAQL